MPAASYAFLRRPVWIAGALIVVLSAALFVRLGLWQLDRHEERQAFNDDLEAGLAADPVPAGELGADLSEAEFRRVSMTGTFAAGQVLLQNRSRRGSAGFHVLAVLQPDSGPAVVVDRGWVPLSVQDEPETIAAPTPGEVTVAGILRLPRAGAVTTPAAGALPPKVSRVDVEALAALTASDLAGFYVELATQEPPRGPGAPLPPEPPQPDAGPHLGYAMQWFAFALIVLIGFPSLVVRTARSRVSPRPAPGRRPPRPAASPRTRPGPPGS